MPANLREQDMKSTSYYLVPAQEQGMHYGISGLRAYDRGKNYLPVFKAWSRELAEDKVKAFSEGDYVIGPAVARLRSNTFQRVVEKGSNFYVWMEVESGLEDATITLNRITTRMSRQAKLHDRRVAALHI